MSVTTHALYGCPYGGPYTAAMAKRRIMGAQEVRQNFSDRLDAAERDGEHTIVLRRSTPSVAVVPAHWYHRACELLGDPWEDWVPPAAAGSTGDETAEG